MVENKKVDAPKTGTTTTAAAKPAPVEVPTSQVATPTVGEVKKGVEIRPEVVVNADPNKPTPDQIISDTVKRTAESVAAHNESLKVESQIVPPEVKAPETVKAPTKEEAIVEAVKRTAESVENFNKSAEAEKKVEAPIGTDPARDLKPDVVRVAPLTGELRSDQEDDSFVTPGKVPKPPEPAAAPPAPEVEPQPLVIAPITGEIKPADEVSFPTPGRIVDPEGLNKAIEIKDVHAFGGKRGQFNVPDGHHVPLFEANKEMIRNKRANREDYRQVAQAMAEAAMTGLDGLRRTRRTQKNLR